MPKGLPQRQSLVAQTAAFLNSQINSGAWHDWLPTERALCEMLQVSRGTLRSALSQLNKEGRTRPIHGLGNQIINPTSRPPAIVLGPRSVALLAPDPLERLPATHTLWIDDIRALLGEHGVPFRVVQSLQYYAVNPSQALQRLVDRDPHGCWILLLATEALQRWFEKSKTPCIVAGSTYAGLRLPYRDLDHRATCRHAAGVLLGLGHRRLVMLMGKQRRAGDLESEGGFLQGVRESHHPEADAGVIYHEETMAGVAHAVERLINLRPMPTALMVVHPYHYLAVATILAQNGLQIPADISVISRDNDPSLTFVAPTPARYAVKPHVLAKALVRPVLELLDSNVVTQLEGKIVPTFLRGESIGAPKEQ